MRVIEGLYTYGYEGKKLDKVLKKIRKGKKIPKLQVVVLPLFQDGLLEIYVYNQLLQPYYKSRSSDIFVVGLSKNKAGAEELVLNMVQDMFDVDKMPADGVDGESRSAVREFFGI